MLLHCQQKNNGISVAFSVEVKVSYAWAGGAMTQ